MCITFESSPNFHVDEAYPIPRDKPTIEDMLQLLLENDEKLLARQERNTLSLQRLALQMSEITSMENEVGISLTCQLMMLQWKMKFQERN